MSEFKPGDDVLVRATWVGGPDPDGDVFVTIEGESRYLPSSDILPVPPTPTPVDPATLKVGDQVRREWTFAECDFIATGFVAFVGDRSIVLGDGMGLAYGGCQWFLLDRPEPVDPRREAVKNVIKGTWPHPLEEEAVDAILAAIDGAR